MAVFLISLWSLVALTVAQQCYYPDGSQSGDVPCNSTATASACCSNTGYCLSNGVCLDSGILSRGSCTDQSWTDPSCCQYCTGDYPSGGSALLPCTSMTFTCGFYPDNCTDPNNVFTISDAQTIVLRDDQLYSAMDAAGVSNTTASVSSSSSSLPGPTGRPLAAAPAAPSSLGSSYTGGDMAAVGLSIAVILLAVIAALSVLLVREKKKHTNVPDQTSRNSMTSSYYPQPYEYTS